MKMTLKSTWSAPRWAGTPRAVKDLAFQLDLVCDLEVETGWFRHHCRLKVTGENDKIKQFREAWNKAIKDYNS